jgi:MFS family permease
MRVAMIALCLSALMTTLDGTIVVVAMPAIALDLGLSQTLLAWVVNAYTLAFAGLLILSGRAGDEFGHRRVFLLGVVTFTGASLGCALSRSDLMFFLARAIQGMGGAALSATTLPLCSDLYPHAGTRVRAFGILGFFYTAGGSIALVLGGMLTSSLGWHWIFLINVPVGIAIYILGTISLPVEPSHGSFKRLDLPGAILLTLSVTGCVFLLLNIEEGGRYRYLTKGILAAAIALGGAFLLTEKNGPSPILPLWILRTRFLITISIMFGLVSAAMSTWYFACTLYLYRILGFDPAAVGAAFLPANVVDAVATLGMAPRIVRILGLKRTLMGSLFVSFGGLVLFSWSKVGGSFLHDVLPGTLLLAAGMGIAYPTLLTVATERFPPGHSGIVSGIVNTASLIGGAVGLAALTGMAAERSDTLAAAGAERMVALNSGYHLEFIFCSVAAISSAVLSSLLPDTHRVSSPADSKLTVIDRTD